MDNSFHRYINLPFEIVKPAHFEEHHDQPKHQAYLDTEADYAKPMLAWLKQFGLKCEFIESFYTPAGGGSIPPHTDNAILTDMVKINITWGPEEGTTKWWSASRIRVFHATPEITENTNKNQTCLLADEKDCTLLYSANTNRPSLIQVGAIHSTYNPGTVGRHTLCFLLYTEDMEHLTWDNAMDIFKDYIE
jgi:hypothetical protein